MIPSLNFSFRQRIKLGFNNTVFGLSGTIFNFIFSIAIIRLFSKELWGSFAQIMLLITLLNLITGWGNKEYLIREFSRSTTFSSLFQTSLVSRLILTIPIILFFIAFDWASGETVLFLIWVISNFLLRSFDSIIVFERKFKQAILIELVGFILTMIGLFLFKDLITMRLLIILFIASSLIRAIPYTILFSNPFLKAWTGTISMKYLIDSLPYFLPPFIGFLQAKSDTFSVALRLSEKELGEYYILLGLLSYCHATAVLAITPFLKNLYRINNDGFKKIKTNFIFAGLAWTIVCMTIIYVMLTYVYEIKFELNTYLIAWLTLPPYFGYFLLMQDFIRKDKPYIIVVINIFAAILNFIASYALIGKYGFSGALLSCSIMQWLLLISFVVASRLKGKAHE